MNLVAPWFLAGLAALALPLILHRFSQERPEERAFASERFLEAVPPPVSRRRRLRYRGLFALRWLALIALCLLFARPWVNALAPLEAPRTLHFAVLDSSFSMRADARFERARDALDARLAALPEGDLVRVFDGGSTLVALGEEPVTPPAARQLLAGIEPGFARTDYGTIMRGLAASASRAALPVVAMIATDAQASALPQRVADLHASDVTALEVIDVSRAAGEPDGASGNVRLDAEAVSADGTIARVDMRLSSDAGTGDEDGTIRGALEVLHEGEVLAREPVELVAGDILERRIEPLTLPAVETPELVVRFEREAGAAGARGDALAEDDEVRIVVRGARDTRVALAGDEATLDERAAVFLATAFGIDEGVAVERVTGGLRELSSDHDIAIIVRARNAEAGADGALRAAVRRGLDVLLLPESAGSALGTPDGAAGGDARGVAIGRVDQAHPLALGEIDWRGVRRYAAPAWQPEPDDRVLVRDVGGEALLYERPIEGAGRLLVLTDALDGTASNLPFEPAFVSLVAAVRRWFDSSGALPAAVTVGESVALPPNAQVFDPDGEALLSLGDRAGAAGDAERIALDRPGLYRVVDARGERSLAVRTDPRESALEPLAGEALDAWQARHAVDGYAPSAAEGADGASDGSSDESAPAARAGGAALADAARAATERVWLTWLLPALVALLLLESLLGNRRLDVRRDGS